MTYTYDGEPITLEGKQLKIGDQLPNAIVLDADGNEASVRDYVGGKPLVISVVPNVLTRVCELQTKHFAEDLKAEDVTFITVSKNTVDEFNEWREEHDVNVVALSDHHDNFGQAFGLTTNFGADNDVLARSVFLFNTQGQLVYQEIVEEMKNEPNYQALLDQL